MKILHFEDDSMLQEMYRTKFKQGGFEYVGYENPLAGGDPVELVLKINPDLIMTGIIMPKMDGFTLIEKLKADPRTKKYKILGLDNLSLPEDKEKAITLGAEDYLVSAHFTPSEVVEVVKKMLAKKV